MRFALGFAIGTTLSVVAVVAGTSVFASGFWNDAGTWSDTDVWKD